jgi:hypothetical protein
MKPENDKSRRIPLEDLVATLVVIVVLAGATLLILRWISVSVTPRFEEISRIIDVIAGKLWPL